MPDLIGAHRRPAWAELRSSLAFVRPRGRGFNSSPVAPAVSQTRSDGEIVRRRIARLNRVERNALRGDSAPRDGALPERDRTIVRPSGSGLGRARAVKGGRGRSGEAKA